MVESLSYYNLQGLFKNEYQTENCIYSQLTKSNSATVWTKFRNVADTWSG